MKSLELRVEPDGKLVGIYDDDLLTVGDRLKVRRASIVEWDSERGGWTVLSAKDHTLAIRAVDWCRWAPAREGTIIAFATREEALQEERKFFWELLEG